MSKCRPCAYGEAQAGPSVSPGGGGVRLRERVEQHVPPRLGDSDARVGHSDAEQRALCASLCGACCPARPLSLRPTRIRIRGHLHGQADLALLGELYGVGQQVQQDLPKPRRVPHNLAADLDIRCVIFIDDTQTKSDLPLARDSRSGRGPCQRMRVLACPAWPRVTSQNVSSRNTVVPGNLQCSYEDRASPVLAAFSQPATPRVSRLKVNYNKLGTWLNTDQVKRQDFGISTKSLWPGAVYTMPEFWTRPAVLPIVA